MNYDRIILELLNRVQTLEEQMAEVKAELSSQDDDREEDEVAEEKGQGGFTRSQARDRAMKLIQTKFPDFVVDKATRKQGSGIKIYKPDSKRPVFIKFFHSRSFEHRSGEFEHSWHVVKLNEVLGSEFDYCLFSMVDSHGSWNFFIYEPEELGIYNEENRSSGNEILHLYFCVHDGAATEVREQIVDVSDHLNNWDILK
jgi:hypothetical protein